MLKQIRSQLFFIFFILFSFRGLLAQDLTLQLTSNDQKEALILKTIDYVKAHKDSTSVHLEINKVSEYLKNLGYFTNAVFKIEKINTTYIGHFSLNSKTKTALIKVNSDSKIYLKKFKIINNRASIPLHELQPTLYTISKQLDKEGKSFSKVQLHDISIHKDTLFANLSINESKKRVINKVVIKGYEKFPESYLKNYFNIKASTIFNQSKIEEIAEASKNINFISVIKPPETLFTTDSTMVYLYLKKKESHSFDGILSFTSKEDGKILLNGNIDLRLNNLLNKGELFELFWNRIGEERQELRLSSKTPYVFNSKFSPEVSFSIYQQDSTFINTNFHSRISYHISPETQLAISYHSESSENLEKNNVENLDTYNNSFIGLQFKYNIPKNDFFFNERLFIEISPSIGQRKIGQQLLNQFKIEATASYLWDINFRNSIYIKNKTFHLNSSSLLYNELYRIGGANSIRGFNEQSIFSSSFSYFNMEYRLLTSEKSYLYTLTDIARVKTMAGNENLLGIGLGYLFTSKNSQINISSALGRNSSKGFDFNQTKLAINWTNFF